MATLRKNVERILKSRGLSEGDLRKRTNLKTDLKRFLDSPHKRSGGIIKQIATELVVPEFFLFSDHLTPEDSIVDFRLSKPVKRGYQRATIKAIEFAKEVQLDASGRDVFVRKNSLAECISGKTPIARAASLRELIGLTDEVQFQFENVRLFYAHVRRQIEQFETMIFQLSFPTADGVGFAITSNSTFNTIVINTNQQIPARRLFTLAHEVYHCILNETGVSDPDVVKNETEILCNRFAAYFLAPTSLVKSAAALTIKSPKLNFEELRAFSELAKLSMSASLYRLVRSGIYSDDAIAIWKAYIKASGSPDAPKKSGGRRVDEWKYKLGKYGTKFAEIYSGQLSEGNIDSYEFYRLSGIKPKYQADYFTNAPTASLQDSEEESDA